MYCICCLEDQDPFIRLASCRHADYLDLFPKLKSTLEQHVVCCNCHGVLVKIQLFKSQVEESLTMRETPKNNITNERMCNLKIHKAVDILLPEITEINVKPGIGDADLEESLPKTNESSENINKGSKIKNMKAALDIIKQNEQHFSFFSTAIQSLNNENISDIILKQNIFETNRVSKTDRHDVDSEEILPPKKLKLDSSDEEDYFDESELLQKINIKTISITNDELVSERALLSQSEEYLGMPYRCDNCIMGFSFEENLRDHVKRRHAPSTDNFIVCDVCNQVFHPTFNDYTIHTSRHYSRYECTVCLMRFSMLDDAHDHHLTHQVSPNSSSANGKC